MTEREGPRETSASVAEVVRTPPRDTATSIARLRGLAERLSTVETLKRERDALIRELHEGGFSEREIANVALMTGPRVHQIITKENA